MSETGRRAGCEAEREPTLEEIGDTSGRPIGEHGIPWWAMWIAAAVTAVAVAIPAYLFGERAAERASSSPSAWEYVGGPPSSSGGAYVYTRCSGPTRLFLTVGGDGFPAGPASVVLFEQGSGCPRVGAP